MSIVGTRAMRRQRGSKPAAGRIGLGNWWQGLAGLVVVVVVWKLATLVHHSMLFPGPGAVALAAIHDARRMVLEMRLTLWRGMLSFVIATVTMVPFGIVAGRVGWLGRSIDPLLGFLVAVPPPAVIPLVMLFAGIGDPAKIAVITYAIAPLILINTMDGARSTPPMLHRVGKSLRLTDLQAMVLLSLPAALPAVLTGLRLAVSTALLVSVTSEMLLATNGIGTFIQRAQDNYQTAGVLAGIATIAVVGLVINLGVRAIERRLLFWYYR